MQTIKTTAYKPSLLLLMMASVLLAGCGMKNLLPSSTPVETSQTDSTIEPPLQQIFCGPNKEPAPHYKKTVALLRYKDLSPGQATEFYGLEQLLSTRLKQYLEQRDRYHLVTSDEYQLASLTINTLGMASEEIEGQIRQVSREKDAQFVITAHIIDKAHIENHGRSTESWPTKAKKLLAKPFASKRRGLSTQIAIYDGASGAKLNQFNYFHQIKGSVLFKERDVFMNSIENSDYGKIIHTTLSQQANDIDANLACLPLMARVINTEGEKIYLSAGMETRINAGENLKILKNRHISTMENGKELNQVIEIADVLVTDVFPRFSIAVHKEPHLSPVSKGDFALTY